MSGLVQPVLVGMAVSVATAFVAWLVARSLRDRVVAHGVALWRAARIAAVLPLLLAPAVYAVPRTIELPVELEFLAPAPAPAEAYEAAEPGAPAAPHWPLPSAGSVLLAVYLLGLGVAAAGAWQRHRSRRRLLAQSRQAGREERAMLEALARRIGVAAPDMRIGRAAVSPFLTGWRGVVVVPADMDTNGEALRFALAHELCHLRRGDERDRLLGAALTTILWFNWPLRRIECELDTAREIACDRDTLDALGGARRRSYAAALIEVMRTTAPAASAFGSQDRRHREMRIKAILSPQRPGKGRAVWLTATLLASALPFAGAQALVTERRIAVQPVETVAEQSAPQGFSSPVGEEILAAQSAQAEENWQASIDRLDPVIAAADTEPHERAIALQMRGRAFYELENLDAAIADWNAAIDTDGMTPQETVNLRMNIGQLQIAGGDVEAGLATLETALEGEDLSLRHRFILAQAYGQTGQFENGLAHAQAVYEAEPGERRNHDLLYFYYQELGMTDALEALGDRPAPDVPKVNRTAAPAPAPAVAAESAPASAPQPQAAPEPLAVPAPALTHPVAHGRISSRYGDRSARPAGAPPFHGGYDIAAAEGTPIVAPGAGVVVHAAAGYRGSERWGNTVAIDHGNGWQTVYAHMQGFDVAPGDRVEAGQQIGRVGTTGASTGPHVHVELHHNGERVDPAEHVPGLR